ncbi:protein of unknown function (plasmid) [Paraburkholderia kururiensis]
MLHRLVVRRHRDSLHVRFPIFLSDKHFGGDIQFPAQATNHRKAQTALSTEYFVDAIQIPDIRLHVAGRKPGLLHPKFDGLDRIGKVEREMLSFIAFDQRGQNFKAIPIR